jgi:four helix bundle protein
MLVLASLYESTMNRNPAKTFEDLIVWQEAHEFVLGVYRFTDSFPKSELYGLTSQLRRAAVSIAANIAEGFKKTGKADKARFFNTSQGSIEECRYYLVLSRDLNYGDPKDLGLLLDEVSKLLTSYRRAVLTSDS